MTIVAQLSIGPCWQEEGRRIGKRLIVNTMNRLFHAVCVNTLLKLPCSTLYNTLYNLEIFKITQRLRDKLKKPMQVYSINKHGHVQRKAIYNFGLYLGRKVFFIKEISTFYEYMSVCIKKYFGCKHPLFCCTLRNFMKCYNDK
uniref:Uncharacterized protein n=1 Tax=Heterorhabditis bacteriophora TaxID=37862 RepID=A0A1I7WVG0_HETBA